MLDELDNAYGDLHSGAVSSESLVLGLSIKTRGVVLAGVALVLALILSALSETTGQLITQFLTILSSIFVPLFGVILARYRSVRQSVAQEPAVAIEWSALVAWAVGVALYWVSQNYYPEWGSALPSILFSFLVASAWPKNSTVLK